MGPGLKDAYPQVEDYVRFRHSPDWIVRYNDRLHYENSVWYVDPSIFASPKIKKDIYGLVQQMVHVVMMGTLLPLLQKQKEWR